MNKRLLAGLHMLLSPAVLELASATSNPAVAQVQPGPAALRQTLLRAAPAVLPRWKTDGQLVYSVGRGNSLSHRTLDPRTGEDLPYLPSSTPESEEPRVVRPGLFAHAPPIREVATRDEAWFASTRDGDVWVRSAASGDSTRLTTGGRPGYGFDIEGAKWSSDGRRLAIKLMDARDVPTTPLVRWSEPGDPVVRHPYSRVGEPIPRAELYVVDLDGGEPTAVELGGADAPYLHIVGWSGEGDDELYFIRASRLMDRLDLLAADPHTGRSRTILQETSSTFMVGLPLLHGYAASADELNLAVPLRDARRFIWTSERDGWRRLYLYDVDGSLLDPLTPEGSEIDRLQAVDEERGWVYYTARVDSERPYDVTLLRAPLDGGAPQRLVSGPTFHHLEFDAGCDFFWTLRGGVDRPPVLELRRADGALVEELWSGAAMAREAGWNPPEQVTARAADGKTELFGLLFKPRDFDSARRYPVVDYLYPGPFRTHVPRSLLDPRYSQSQALADLGFIVLVVDARGTPERGKAFNDAFHGQFGQHEIADHAAVLRRLAAERPYMDLARVGAFGHSMGGYGAVRALLLEPGLYRVAVASAPAVDLAQFRIWVEPYMGCLPRDCPEAYQRGASTRLAERLQGKLLLLHGTSDDDVPFGEAIGLMDALNRANKAYDVVVFPEGTHNIQGPYWWQRVTDYLREHLRP